MDKIAKQLFDKWNKALLVSPKAVANLYTDDAILLGTINGKFRKGKKEIEGYFKLFCPLIPVGKITKNGTLGDEKIFTHFGHYTFILASKEVINARFTFIYKKDKLTGEYKIIHHHSSRIPEN